MLSCVPARGKHPVALPTGLERNQLCESRVLLKQAIGTQPYTVPAQQEPPRPVVGGKFGPGL